MFTERELQDYDISLVVLKFRNATLIDSSSIGNLHALQTLQIVRSEAVIWLSSLERNVELLIKCAYLMIRLQDGDCVRSINSFCDGKLIHHCHIPPPPSNAPGDLTSPVTYN